MKSFMGKFDKSLMGMKDMAINLSENNASYWVLSLLDNHDVWDDIWGDVIWGWEFSKAQTTEVIT